MRTEVLGLPVDILSRNETIEKIADWLRTPSKKTRMVVTAYSEFYVNARKDKVFGDIIKKADLVTPDGVSVLAAVRYASQAKRKNIFEKLVEGLRVGGDILAGRIGETVTGVWLFEELTTKAEKEGWRIFLLGGWGDVSLRAAERLLERHPKIKVMSDPGEVRVGTDRSTDERVVKKINAFKPDILFVQYNPIKQEKWIASHLSRLDVGIALGVGGTFNEFLGEFRPTPKWMENMGLKWLWRVIVEPRRLGRIFKAVVIFPWLVFKEGI